MYARMSWLADVLNSVSPVSDGTRATGRGGDETDDRVPLFPRFRLECDMLQTTGDKTLFYDIAKDGEQGNFFTKASTNCAKCLRKDITFIMRIRHHPTGTMICTC